ncbi:MAG: sulfite exporter TauE/SafE family protein [Caldimicrobium sp.]
MFDLWYFAFILFISGIIHGLVGFAFALTALPLLALIKSVKFAVPLLSLYSFTVNLVMLIVLKEKRLLKIPLYFFLFIFLGVFLGVQGFTLSSEYTLRVVLFIAILAYFLWELFQMKRNREKEFVVEIDPKVFKSPLSLGIAFIVGLLGGLLNTPGPPIVIYLSLLKFDKNLFKATLQLIFAFSSIMAAFNHYLVGNLTFDIFKIYLYLLPCVLLGLYLGQKTYTKLSNKVYYYLVNVFLLLSALLLLIKPIH